MKQYLSLVKDILDNGIKSGDRTGTGTISVFGRSISHNYSDGFPLLTTKKMFTRGIIGELLWFLKGTADASFLIENNIHIWDEWMLDTPNGKTLPHTYGIKWRNFGGVDQIQKVINDLKVNPKSRRHIVSAWDPVNVDNAALPWCHILFQFNVTLDKDRGFVAEDGKSGDLNIAVYQRSCDVFLGGPYNIASYSFLLYMICELTGYRPGSMYYTFGDSHIYLNHIDQCKEQISRTPFSLPTLVVANKGSIDDFDFGDFQITNYQCHPKISGKVSV